MLNHKLLIFLAVLVIFACLPVFADVISTDLTPALNRVRAEITARNVLSEKETNRIMARTRTQFERMSKAGVEQGKINQVANQSCYLIRSMTQNAGELKQISNAVALMAKETINGGNPEAIGQMLQKNLTESRNMSKAIKQTQAQIQQQSKTQTKTGSTHGGGGNGSRSSGKGSHGAGGKKR